MWLLFAVIGNVLWSISDISQSMIVHRYEKDPISISWIQSIFEIVLLATAAIFMDVQSEWILQFAVAGVFGYLGFIMFFFVIHRVDVSVLNAAWAFQAVFICAASFVFFQETWSISQSIGAILIFIGVLILSYWHKHVSILHTILLLSGLGLLYAPFFVIQKAALLNGESIYATFFWPAFMAKIIAFTFPLFRNTCRKNIYRMLPRINIWFLLLNVIATFSSILGFFFMTNAYAVGLASLVAVTENMQPFCVIFLAWLVAFLVPKCAPRELLTIQSVQVKLVSFLIVFVGLGLLSV